MLKPFVALTLMALALPLPLAAQTNSDGAEGPVMVIRINTPDGPRWYRLGAEIEAVDVTEGRVVQFDYLGDDIEAITVVPEDAQDPDQTE